MNEEYSILSHDLRILEAMAVDMAAYLDSDVIKWTIPRANMPRLTIGGYLMREQRLLALAATFTAEDRGRLHESIQKFNDALIERVVRFEKRAHQELHSRLSEWVGHLRDMGSQISSEVNYYAGIVDTRVVIHELVSKLQAPPYRLEDGVSQEIETLDKNLKARIQDCPFIWDEVWKPAYPRATYWWLYVSPT